MNGWAYFIIIIIIRIRAMSHIPTISQQVRDQLMQKGYDSNIAYQLNRLPKYAIPRTTQYNLYSAFLIGGSLIGLLVTKRAGLAQNGFGFALGTTFILDFFHRRQLDNPNHFSSISSPTFQIQLNKYPEFKKAFNDINQEMDNRILQLQSIKASRSKAE